MSKRGVAYIKQDEPSFLRDFKQKVGYKEEPTVDTKRQVPTRPDSDEDGELEDEKPTVVVLKAGDLTAEEAEHFQTQDTKTKTESPKLDDDVPADGRILFKKPVKRSGEQDQSELSASSSKKKKHVDGKDDSKKASVSQKVKNACLLSFDAEEDEEDG